MRQKILILASCLLFFFLCNGVNAMWAKMSYTELIEKSVVVLIGEMIGQNEVALPSDQSHRCISVLKVDEVLKGDKDQTVIFLLMLCKVLKSDDIIFKKGRKGVWFLRLRSNEEQGIYIADNPQRFVTSEKAKNDLTEIRRIISEQMN